MAAYEMIGMDRLKWSTNLSSRGMKHTDILRGNDVDQGGSF